MRFWLALGLAALAPFATGALTPEPAAPLEGPVELTVGERRALVTDDAHRARVIPAGLADVTRIGPRTVVLTPHRAGAGRLELTAADRTWDVPLDVSPRVLEAFTDDAPDRPGDVQHAPPPFRLHARRAPAMVRP